MHIIYIDDSHDQNKWIFAALAIPEENWKKDLAALRRFRHDLKVSDGILVHKEFHATEFVGGRGRLSRTIVTKFRRSEIFKDTLRAVASLSGARLFCTCFPTREGVDEVSFDFLLNRINQTMKNWRSRAILICDEGKEASYTRLVRRMGLSNPIVSKFRYWPETGTKTKNVPINRIIEDPIFKRSEQSYFIQLSDFCAFALLRRENPIPSKNKYGLNKAFDVLKPIIVKEATRRDPEGIIRP